jgi:hypothetical protein
MSKNIEDGILDAAQAIWDRILDGPDGPKSADDIEKIIRKELCVPEPPVEADDQEEQRSHAQRQAIINRFRDHQGPGERKP